MLSLFEGFPPEKVVLSRVPLQPRAMVPMSEKRA